MKRSSLNKIIQLRVSEYDKNKIKMFADKYAGGNISKWVIYSAINAPRKMLADKKEGIKKNSSLT